MNEDITIINEKVKSEKIKIFFHQNKIKFIILLVLLILSILSFYTYQAFRDKHQKMLSDKYNATIINFKISNKSQAISSMKEIINAKDSTYSPLALYFLIDENLVENRNEINNLFDILIDKTSLKDEIKYLIIYKKALYNADFYNESELLGTLNPLINSESVWKSHALYLIAEYFYSKNEKQKSKEFFIQIINLENANEDLRIESQKRLNRDLSD